MVTPSPLDAPTTTAKPRIKILDLGLARVRSGMESGEKVASSLTQAGQLLGTPDYMAPEQIRGERGDARTDVYALGMMLFEMLAGKMPFEGDNALAIMDQHVNREAPMVRTYRPDVPPQLESIVAKAIRRDPKQRYQSMLELRHDLQHWQSVGPYAWFDEPKPVGAMPDPLKAIGLVLVVLAALTMIGFLAQMAHGVR